MKINRDINILVKEEVDKVISKLFNDGYKMYFNNMNLDSGTSNFLSEDEFDSIMDKKEYILEKNNKKYLLFICSVSHRKEMRLYTYRIYIKEFCDEMYHKINHNSKMMMDLYIARTQDDNHMLMDGLDSAMKMVHKINKRVENKTKRQSMTIILKKTRFKGFKKYMKVEIMIGGYNETPHQRLTNKNGKTITVAFNGCWHDLELDTK